jgi:ATP-dependent 26S proteasome regulatory subunit
MSDLISFTDILERYLKARIPFISIRSSERSRVLEVVRNLAQKINIPTYVHTLSQGMRDLVHHRTVSEDRSIMGAVDFMSSQFTQRQNLTYVLTEVSDLEDDTPTARYFYDVAMLAAETGGSVVVVTSNPVWNQLARLGMSITLDVPNEDEMLTIIQEQISPYRGQIPINWTEQEEKEAAAILSGISQIEAENVIATLLAKGKIEKEDLVELTQVKDSVFSDISGLERIYIKDQELTVGGLEGLRKWLDHERPLLTADLRERGIRPPRGVLLVGVPGCGKSLSAKAIASSWNLPLYRLDLSTIYGQYVGQSEGRLKEALSTADHVSPCVLWIDEIEKGLAGSQGDSSGVTNRLVGQFLFWLQEARSRVFVVATANDVSKLPPELLRRGRFDELFFVDLPTPEERRDIINIYIHRGLKRSLDDRLLDELVRLSEGFAGADIESAVRDVVKEAFLKGDNSITVDLFRRSFQNVVPLSQTSPEQIQAIRTWGRERAVSASGRPIADDPNLGQMKRNMLYP